MLTFLGTVEFMPIHFMHKSVNFDELLALYAVSDVCLVSSTRDGMNLVSYEYIASQKNRNGVLVLSEFTGAAQSLNGSILVNPWNTEELAGAMQEAVTMSCEQRAVNFSKLDKYVSKYTRQVAIPYWHQLLLIPYLVLSGVSRLSPSLREYQHTEKRRSSSGGHLWLNLNHPQIQSSRKRMARKRL